MKEVLRTHQPVFADAVRWALEAEGIEAELFDEHAIASIGPAGEIRVMVPDTAIESARSILATFERSWAERPAPRSWRWHRPSLISFGAAFVGLLLTAAASEASWPKPITVGLLALVGGLVALGVVLLVIGMVIDTKERLREGRDDRATRPAS